MDEVLRSRRLMQEILQRAESIKSTMSQVNESMARMNLQKQSSLTAPDAPPGLALLDLPDGCLTLMAQHLRDFKSVLFFAQTCKRLRRLIEEDANNWEAMCRSEWYITESDPFLVPRLVQVGMDRSSDDGTERSSAPASSSLRSSFNGGLHSSSGLRSSISGHVMLHSLSAKPQPQAHSISSPDGPGSVGRGGLHRSLSVLTGGSSGGSSPMVSPAKRTVTAASMWRMIYKDRVQGWQLVLEILCWLRDHGCPRTVSGALHRMQLSLALKYMALNTSHAQAAPRRQEILAHDGLKALVALLDNDSLGVVEMALEVLANLMYQNSDAVISVMMLTHMGKLLSDKLDGERALPGIVLHASRGLVSLWSSASEAPRTPEVGMVAGSSSTATSCTAGASWMASLQEYSLRGESMKLLDLFLSFKPQGKVLHVAGSGQDDADGAYTVVGEVDPATGLWSFQRNITQGQQTIMYKGYSDHHGAWGMYYPKRIDNSFFATGRSRQPRVFRLFHTSVVLPGR